MAENRTPGSIDFARRELLQSYAAQQYGYVNSSLFTHLEALQNITEYSIGLVDSSYAERSSLFNYSWASGESRSDLVINDLFSVIVGDGLFPATGRSSGEHFVGHTLGASGYRPEFRDNHNQTQHAVGGLYGGYYAPGFAESLAILNEFRVNQPQDALLYGAAFGVANDLNDSTLNKLPLNLGLAFGDQDHIQSGALHPYSAPFQYRGYSGNTSQNYGFSTGFNDQSYSDGIFSDIFGSVGGGGTAEPWGSNSLFNYGGYTGGANNTYGPFSSTFGQQNYYNNPYDRGHSDFYYSGSYDFGGSSNYISDPSAPYSSLFGSGSSYDWGASYSTPTSSYTSNPFSYSGYTGGGSSSYGYSTGFNDLSYDYGSSYGGSSYSSYDYGSSYSSSSYISSSSWGSSYSDTFSYSGYTGGSSSYGGSSSGSWGSWGWPVVLDLDGDGVEIVTLDQSPAFFDFDEDSYQENSVVNTSWAIETGLGINAANDNQASFKRAA